MNQELTGKLVKALRAIVVVSLGLLGLAVAIDYFFTCLCVCGSHLSVMDEEKHVVRSVSVRRGPELTNQPEQPAATQTESPTNSVKIPAQLMKVQWGVGFAEVANDEKYPGKLKLVTMFAFDSTKKLRPVVGDKILVRTVGSKAEQAFAVVEKIIDQKDPDYLLVFVALRDMPDAWMQRKWEDKRGFDVFGLFPVPDKGVGFWADRNCHIHDMPDSRGVSCETLDYLIRNSKSDELLLASFTYKLKGSFDPTTGIFASDYTASKTFVRDGKNWSLLNGEILPE